MIRIEETNQYVHHLTSNYKNVIVGSIIPEYKEGYCALIET